MGPFATFHRHPLAARSAVAMSAGWTGRSGHGRHVGCHAALLRGPAAGAPTSPRRWAWAIWAWEDSEGLAGEDWGKMWETPAEFGWRRRFFCLKLVVSTAVFFVLVESLAICHDEQTSSSFIIHAKQHPSLRIQLCDDIDDGWWAKSCALVGRGLMQDVGSLPFAGRTFSYVDMGQVWSSLVLYKTSRPMTIDHWAKDDALFSPHSVLF